MTDARNAKPKRPAKKPSRKAGYHDREAKAFIRHALPRWREYQKLFPKVNRMAKRAGVDVSDFIQPCPIGSASMDLRLQNIPDHGNYSVTSIHFRRAGTGRKIFLFASGFEFQIKDAPGMSIIKDWAIAMPARYLRVKNPGHAIIQDYVDALLRIAHTGKDSPAPPAQTRSAQT